MPKVSIVLPTYNRADILPRALASVARQSYSDWELIVVDDGSTDATESVVKDFGIPIRYLRAGHGGVSAARNVGIRASEGEFVAFLDSDDEWDTGFLSVSAGFLESNPEAQIVVTELQQDFGQGHGAVHPRIRFESWYPDLARRVGSHALDLPPGVSDPYMRVFTDRVDVTDWFNKISGTEQRGEVIRYYGDVFPYFRWGYLFSVTSAMVRRSAIDEAGLFDESLSSGEDFLFLAKICQRHAAHLIAWPGLIKHEYGEGGRETQEGHLATSGRRMIQFHINMLRVFDTLYNVNDPSDHELRRLRGFWLFDIARIALRLGDVQLARQYLEESLKFSPKLRVARAAFILTKIMPWIGGRLYGPAVKALAVGERVVHGHFDFQGFLRRLFHSKQNHQSL